MQNRETWKLLALLGGLNLLVGVVLIAVGAAYDFLGRSPGTIAMLGVGLAGAPWLALSTHLKHQLKIHRERDAMQLAREARDFASALNSQTGVHRAVQAIVAERGDDAVRLALLRGEDE